MGIWAHTGGSGLHLVASEGAAALGAHGATWGSFTSLTVVEGRGPMFTAKLLPGPSSMPTANDIGWWVTDSTGALRLMLRSGDLLLDRKLTSFFVLGAVGGSPGQRRAWSSGDASARVIYSAAFADGTGAILSSVLP